MQYKEIERHWVQSHIWLTASSYCIWRNICVFPHILGSPSSYMTLHPIPFEFPYIWGKICCLFYQCGTPAYWRSKQKQNPRNLFYLRSLFVLFCLLSRCRRIPEAIDAASSGYSDWSDFPVAAFFSVIPGYQNWTFDYDWLTAQSAKLKRKIFSIIPVTSWSQTKS